MGKSRGLRTFAMILGPGVLLSACDGPQSALSATGADAIAMEGLFWVMLIGATLIWILINGLIYYVTRVYTGSLSPRLAHGLIVGGGIIFPLVVVTSLLVYGLSAMPEQRAMGDGVKLRITGEQWWWRVEYWPEGADPANPPVAVSANEIRLPAGSRAEIELTAAKVIHSFWIPALGGKLDMFPGRVTRMSLKPLSVGVYRGQCAEFCGQSHALMALNAVVMEPGDFDAWLKAEAQDAAPPKGYAATRGAEIFAQQGCGACHAVRGTPARGGVGPDLTHLGGRTSLAAGILPMDREALMKWILSPASLKPGARMPGYDHLEREDLSALATYLEGLK